MINNNLINDILDWHKQAFPYATLESQIAKLEEEIKEVDDSNNMQEFYKELSDCYIVAIALKRWSDYASVLAFSKIRELEKDVTWGIPDKSFEAMIVAKLEINKKRKWGLIDGVYRHINNED